MAIVHRAQPADVFCVKLKEGLRPRKTSCFNKWLESSQVKRLTGSYDLVNGLYKIGKATVEFKTGHTFTGNLGGVKRMASGSGVLTFPNGSRFEGTFKDGYPCKGKLIFTDGTRYVGSYDSQRRFIVHANGGESIWQVDSDGEAGFAGLGYSSDFIFTGEFDSTGKLQGEGTIQIAKIGSELKGYFNQNTMEGTLIYSEEAIREKFVGLLEWSLKCYSKSCDLYDFEKKLIRGALTLRHGLYGLSDGAIYEGPFDGTDPHGEGRVIEEGVHYRVRYDQGQLLEKIRENPPPPPPPGGAAKAGGLNLAGRLERQQADKNGSNLEQGLQNWVNEAPLSEKSDREKAKRKIMILLETQSSYLSLADLGLTSLPPQIGLLTQLTWLDLSSNQLTSLPPEIGLLTQLTWLDLKVNLLTSLPPQIGQLIQLISLDLSDNQLTSLPPEIGQLTQLPRLYLINNQLTSLPSQIGQLTQLTVLSLSGNQLTSLPPEIGQLAQLTRLGLICNQLSSLPEEILSLSRADIDVSHNPLSPHVIVNLQQVTSAPDYRGPRIQFSIYEARGTEEPTLGQLLQELSQAVQREPLQLIHLMQHAENVRAWLSRLSAIGDYKTKRQQLAPVIYEAIVHAEADEGFRQIFLNCIEGAAETCGDRMALSLLYMDLQHEIAKALKAQDLKRLAYLLGHGSWALSELEKIAGNKARSLHFVDEVEVYLAYPVMLKERLQLPIVIDTMLYFRCSSVTEADLQAAEEVIRGGLSNLDTYCDTLAKELTWHKALEQRADYKNLRNKRDSSEDPVAAQEAFLSEVKSLTLQVLSKVGYPLFIQIKR